MPECTFRILRTTNELDAFVPAWCALWQKDSAATPFQHPDWLVPWWHHFTQPELLAVIMYRAADPVGFLPFYIYPDERSGERQLLLLGAGTSDYLDGIFAPECEIGQIRAALDLLATREHWDILHAAQLRPSSKLALAMEHLATKPFNGEPCSRMDAVTIADLPLKIRRNAMYYRNRAQRLGPLELTVEEGSSIATAFEALVGLHTARWQERGETGVLADPQVLAWHREALPLLARSGSLRLCALRLKGSIIAVLYSLIDPPSRADRTQYFYLTAYSTADADLRPGTLLLALAIEHATQEGVRTIDMLRGNEAYKQIWHLAKTPTCGFSLEHSAGASA